MFFDMGYNMAVSVEKHMLKVEHFLKHGLRATSRSVGMRVPIPKHLAEVATTARWMRKEIE